MSVPEKNRADEFLDRLRLFESPPHGFEPREASADELRRYGYPRRPDPGKEPIFAGLWEDAFGAGTRLIKPELSIDPIMSARRSRQLRDAGRGPVDEKEFAASGWAGAILSPPPGDPLTAVSGSWTVPTVGSLGNLPRGHYVIGFWIGLDGYFSSGQVVQAGVAASIDVPDGFTYYWAWFEWYPGPSIKIDNFEVFYNDTISMTVCTPSNDRGFVSLKNQRTGVATSVGIPQPSPTVLSDGTSAEWAVEATNNYLPYFSSVQFHDCSAGSRNHQLDLGNDHYVSEIRGNGRDLTRSNVLHHVVVSKGHPTIIVNNVSVDFLASGA